jgi:hypothetical protein
MTSAPHPACEQTRPAQTANPASAMSPGSNPLVPLEPEILQPGDKEKHAASLNDRELIAHVQTTLHNFSDDLPYLREARNRFAQPGRRVPVEGQPTWKEWVEANLHVKIRTVQRWLEDPKPKKEKKVRPVKPLKDWQQAQRRANDLVTAVTRLKNRESVGADVLLPALRELAAMVGCQLLKPKTESKPKLEPTVSVLPALTQAAPEEDEPGPRQPAKRNKDTNAIAAMHGWATDGYGHSKYIGV